MSWMEFYWHDTGASIYKAQPIICWDIPYLLSFKSNTHPSTWLLYLPLTLNSLGQLISRNFYWIKSQVRFILNNMIQWQLEMYMASYLIFVKFKYFSSNEKSQHCKIPAAYVPSNKWTKYRTVFAIGYFFW